MPDNDAPNSSENLENNLTYITNYDKIENNKIIDINDEFYFDDYKDSYEDYLRNISIRHQKALRYASKNCPEYQVNDDNIIYAYDEVRDVLLYNPEHKYFKFYNFDTTYTHELSHYLDNHFFKSFENQQFIKAISENSYTNQHIQKFIDKYKIKLDKEMKLSDIISALTINKFDVKYGHDTEY